MDTTTKATFGYAPTIALLTLAALVLACSAPMGSDNPSAGGNEAGAPLVDAGGDSTTVHPSKPDAGNPDAGNASHSDAGTATADAGADAAPIPGWPDPDAAALPPPDFGPNVLIFDPTMSATDVQSKLDAVSAIENAPTPQTPAGYGYGAEFSPNRYAYFFKPGTYNADVKVGFYTQALGLGHSPDDVTISGAVRVKADWRTDDPGDALLNFWRGAENLAVIPTLAEDHSVDVWAVSQATHLRRIHVKGGIVLSDGGYSSGGFIADSMIDTQINCGTQQQFLTRNTNLTSWTGGSWNMVFLGDGQPPSGSWPGSPFSVVAQTPRIREKPFLFLEGNGNYYVMVPGLKTNSQGPSWSSSAAPGYSVPIDQFYLARPGTDTAATMNAALTQGQNLILTPGVYHLKDAIQVTRPGTIVLGLGLTTLIPDTGAEAMTIADVDGVTIGGIIFEAGVTDSPTLLHLGAAGSKADHSANPTALFDVHCRVGGADPGTADSCVTIDSNDVLIDHSWLWRADDGAGVGWTDNKSKNGLIVNGDRVSAYGLFVEHFQEYQTMWNGNDGTLYFYQSEMPYDPPTQSDWEEAAGTTGYASYKVGSGVTSHEARGMGVYCVFGNAVTAENAVETPTAAGVSMHDIVTARFGGASGSGINHIINGTGNAINASNMSARTPN
jgi:hypothetical protein